MTFEIKKYDSPNFNARPADTKINTVIIHYTQIATIEESLQRLTSPKYQVSSHYVIGTEGEIFSLVDEKDRAWHAGVSDWDGVSNLNNNSIGIEIVYQRNEETWICPPYPEIQIESLKFLLSDIHDRHEINPFYILGHSDVAPGRKIDPGEALPWETLAEDGFGIWFEDYEDQDLESLKVGDKGEKVKKFQNDLLAYGYKISADGIYGSDTNSVVQAFQRHFRASNFDGVADSETQSRILNLVIQKRRDTCKA